MSEYDCVGVTSEYLDSLKNKIAELEQHKNTLEQYLRIEKEVSNETIKELEQQKAELIEALSNERDKLYNNLPSGDIKAWDLLIVIKNHISNIDELLCEHTEEERDELQ